MKKLRRLIFIIILVFIAFLYFYLRPKDYKYEYLVKGYKIIEKYYQKEKYYYFLITKKDYSYDFIKELKYSTKRGLIDDFKEVSDEGANCILPIVKDTDTYPLCNAGIPVSYFFLDNDKLKELYKINNKSVEEEYNEINIYSYNNNTYLIWNYKGFYFINEDIKKEIKLFKKDIYEIPLATVVNNYLFIPNYETEHTFKEVFVINLKTGNKQKWTLDKEISYNSYILGTFDKSIYLFDKKSKKEYELVPHKKRMRNVIKNGQGKIYQGEWKSISVNKLSTAENKFIYNDIYKYESNGNLTLKYADNSLVTRILLIDRIKLVSTYRETAYYLREEKLYSYNPYRGEELLLSNFEWNFNKDNMIFIYNNEK